MHAAVTTEGKQGSIMAAFTRLGSRLVVFPYHCDSRNHHDEQQWTAEILLGLLTLPVLSRHDGFLSHHDKEV